MTEPMKLWTAALLTAMVLTVPSCARDTRDEVTGIFDGLVPPDRYTFEETKVTEPDHSPFSRQLGSVLVSWSIDDPDVSLGDVTAGIHEYFTSQGFVLAYSNGRTTTECSAEWIIVAYANEQMTIDIFYYVGTGGFSMQTLWDDDWIQGQDSDYVAVAELPVCGDDAAGWRT